MPTPVSTVANELVSRTGSTAGPLTVLSRGPAAWADERTTTAATWWRGVSRDGTASRTGASERRADAILGQR